MHCSGVAVSCRKHADAITSISTPASASTIDNIRQIYGSAIANELVSYEVSDASWGFQASGWATNANYHVKKSTILIFINHRSVESSTIKKSIELTYSAYLPKGGHPFVYLNLHIEPARVDVNVHPTKREVNFLNEEEIADSICASIRENLVQVDESRTFTTQSLLPTSSRRSGPAQRTSNEQHLKTPSTQKVQESSLVRTDPHIRKITSMLPPPSQGLHSGGGRDMASLEYNITPRERVECRLTSIKILRAAVRDKMHVGLTETLSALTYVGLVDPTRRLAAIQSGVKLLLVDYGLFSREYFYQLGLADFANFGVLKFEHPLDLRALIKIGIETERVKVGATADDSLNPTDVSNLITLKLISKGDMLFEYFNLQISGKGELLSLPLLLKGYTPQMAKLPRFLMRLGPCVDWEDERKFFEDFLRELSKFYALEQLPSAQCEKLQSHESNISGTNGQAESPNFEQGYLKDGESFRTRVLDLERVLEHILFPAFRARLVPTQCLLKGVVEAADLKGLYRVFERC